MYEPSPGRHLSLTHEQAFPVCLPALHCTSRSSISTASSLAVGTSCTAAAAGVSVSTVTQIYPHNRPGPGQDQASPQGRTWSFSECSAERKARRPCSSSSTESINCNPMDCVILVSKQGTCTSTCTWLVYAQPWMSHHSSEFKP